jgi:hypothetical protein
MRDRVTYPLLKGERAGTKLAAGKVITKQDGTIVLR